MKQAHPDCPSSDIFQGSITPKEKQGLPREQVRDEPERLEAAACIPVQVNHAREALPALLHLFLKEESKRKKEEESGVTHKK